jgi:hypothetical protein
VRDAAATLPNPAEKVIKAAPLRSTAPGRARTGLRPWGADPARRAGQPGSGRLARSDRQHHEAAEMSPYLSAAPVSWSWPLLRGSRPAS